MPLPYRKSILFLLVILAIFNTWATASFKDDHTTIDQAASVSNANLNSDETYVSLLDIIAESIARIRNHAEFTATSSATTISTSTKPQEQSPASTSDLADAIVNIFCTQETSKYNRTVSGTGFFISNTGVILTNAHVAQFLLLESENGTKAQCQVRTGEDANTSYTAGLLYISPAFVIEHVDLFSNPNPRGTGENDFALLYIADTADKQSHLPNFAFIPPIKETLNVEMRGRTVILVGYPSGADTSIDNQTRTIATTTITELYTFNDGLADIISLGESKLGHQGASGGPVIDNLGRAIGVISTKSSKSTALNAITIEYIDRLMRKETGFDLASTIQGDLAYRAELFNDTVTPILKKLIVN